MELSGRITKIESALPTLATKEDLVREVAALRCEMHKEFTVQTWRVMTWFSGVALALVSAIYYIVRH